MRRNWLYILISLAERDRHGSGIMRDVLELTDGELKLWPATLYGSLNELEEQGWIRVLDKRPAGEPAASSHEKWFHITAAGRRALAAEGERLQATARTAATRLARSGDA
jgi:DNA-binding PadR family transcriptional regulator